MSRGEVMFFLALSGVGALCVATIAWLGHGGSEPVDLWGRIMVGVPFIISCILGITMAVRPRWIPSTREVRSSEPRGEGIGTAVRGHHPDCGGFEGHVVHLKGRTLCLGCTGLAIGSIIAAVMVILYAMGFWSPSTATAQAMVVLGMGLVGLVFLDTASIWNWALHLIMNVLLVIAFLLMVVGVFELTGRPPYAWVVMVVCFLWLETRIRISNWRNEHTCRKCARGCGMFGDL